MAVYHAEVKCPVGRVSCCAGDVVRTGNIHELNVGRLLHSLLYLRSAKIGDFAQLVNFGELDGYIECISVCKFLRDSVGFDAFQVEAGFEAL